MSPNVNSFVHDLVAMATAMDRLPVVERELSEGQAREERLNLDINILKADLEQSRNYAASLEQKVRTTEAERDDAELRFLELEDKSVNILAMAKAARVSLDQMTGLLDPPKPQPEPTKDMVALGEEVALNYPNSPPIPEAVQSIEPQPQGQGESPPISAPMTSTEDLSKSSVEAPQPPASQDQSEVNPTTTANAGEEKSEQTSATSSVTGDVTSASPSGPYTDKRYFYHAGYVPFSEWIRGGGTEADYNWRPVSNHDF